MPEMAIKTSCRAVAMSMVRRSSLMLGQSFRRSENTGTISAKHSPYHQNRSSLGSKVVSATQNSISAGVLGSYLNCCIVKLNPKSKLKRELAQNSYSSTFTSVNSLILHASRRSWSGDASELSRTNSWYWVFDPNANHSRTLTKHLLLCQALLLNGLSH